MSLEDCHSFAGPRPRRGLQRGKPCLVTSVPGPTGNQSGQGQHLRPYVVRSQRNSPASAVTSGGTS